MSVSETTKREVFVTAFRSTIFWKAFLSLVLGLLAWMPIFFALTVPVVNRLAFDVEETAARNVLDNVVQTVRQAHGDIAAWRESAVESHKREMRSVVLVAEAWARQLQRQVVTGQLTQAQAKKAFFDGVRHLRFGNGAYVWVADTRSFVHVHPDPQLDHRDASSFRDSKGSMVFPPMVEDALAHEEGYASNWWRRMDTWREEEQLTYFHYFPDWQLVIGTGVFLDDIRAEVARRKQALVDDLRRNLHETKLPHAGIVVVVDGMKDVVIHPDPKVEGKSLFAPELLARTAGFDLGQAWIDAAGSPGGRLNYRFAGDGAAGGDQKVAWVRHIPEFDWYLGASVYERELGRSGEFLATRLMIAFAIGLLITALAAFIFIRNLTRPIRVLSGVAQRQMDGDLQAEADIHRNDELGTLASAFNAMVRRLRGQIETLEERVAERTQELGEWAAHLEERVAERTAELAASDLRYQAVVENSVVGIFVLQNQRFVYANQAFATIHGFESPDQLMREAVTEDLLDPAVREEVNEDVKRLMTGEVTTVQRELSILRRDGTLGTAEFSGCLIDFGGSPAIIGVVSDVTERHEAELARERALAEAEHLSRLKSDFIANMSHEFRTPLNIIMGMAHVGQRAKTLEKSQEACGQILGQSRRLLELVTQLLDFSSIESGRIELAQADLELAAIVRDVKASFAPAAEAKGLDLAVAVAPDVPARYLGDGERIRRVVSTLVENAVKFTESGRVEVALAREGDSVVFRVSDTGIGMDDAKLGGLFRPFVQGDGTSTRQHSGMGLSLALAERFALLMGGTIEAESTPGQGSIFTLRLPCRERAQDAAPA